LSSSAVLSLMLGAGGPHEAIIMIMVLAYSAEESSSLQPSHLCQNDQRWRAIAVASFARSSEYRSCATPTISDHTRAHCPQAHDSPPAEMNFDMVNALYGLVAII